MELLSRLNHAGTSKSPTQIRAAFVVRPGVTGDKVTSSAIGDALSWASGRSRPVVVSGHRLEQRVGGGGPASQVWVWAVADLVQRFSNNRKQHAMQ